MKNSKPHSVIIGFSGKLNAGKDFSARLTQGLVTEEYSELEVDLFDFCNNESKEYRDRVSGITTRYYADKLKMMAHVATGVPLERFYSREGKDEMLPAPFDRFSIRTFLTSLGDACRGINHHFFSKGLFVDYKVEDGTGSLFPDVQALKYGDNWIIPDVRFEDEIQAIEERGGLVIRVDRPLESRHGYSALEDIQKEAPELYQKLMHKSETALDNHEFKYRFTWEDDGFELIEQLDLFLKEQNYYHARG